MTNDTFSTFLLSNDIVRTRELADTYLELLYDGVSYESLANMISIDIDVLRKNSIDISETINSFKKIQIRCIALTIATATFDENLRKKEEDSLSKVFKNTILD